MEDSKDYHEMCKEVDDIELSASNNKGATVAIQQLVGTLVDDNRHTDATTTTRTTTTTTIDDNKIDDKLEDGECKISLRKTFSVCDSAMSPETNNTTQDNTPTSSNDAESSSSSSSCFSNQNKCKRSISKGAAVSIVAQANGGDSCDDSNRSSDEESSKHQKLNENVSNELKSEDKSTSKARTSKEPVMDGGGGGDGDGGGGGGGGGCCNERFVQDVEMRSAELEKASASASAAVAVATAAAGNLKEASGREERTETDTDGSYAGDAGTRTQARRVTFRPDLFEESVASNYSRSSAAEHMASEEESEVPQADFSACLKKKVPKPSWYVVPELVHREMGMNPLFPRRCYGSLHVVERFQLTYELREHEGCVNALNFNKAGNLLASGSDDLNVVIWDWARGRRRANFVSQHKSNIFQVKWMYYAEHLVATCARDGQVRLLDTTGGRGTSRKLATHNAPTHKLALHPDTPDVIISVGEDAKVLSIDIRESKPTKLLVVKNGSARLRLYSVHSNPLSSNEFCVSGQFQFVKVYDRRNVSVPIYELCPKHLTENKNVHVTCALYNYNGTEILASYNDEDIYLFDTVSPQPGDFAHKYEGHRNSATVKGVNFFGPKSEYVISGSDCRNIFIWDKNSEAIVNWMFGDENGVVNCLEPHPHTPILATSGLDCGVKIWVPTKKKPLPFDELKDCVASNATNRSQETHSETDAIDSQLLWILVRHIRHTERVRSMRTSTPRNRAVDDDDDDDDDDGDDEDDDDDDEDDDNVDDSLDDDSSDHSDSQSDGDSVRRFQCSPS
ncbi:DDB1- and CUL4-associated factor 8-like isoform X2 [Ceratina calcarata]|uniref:DDB1- and CUL4-associated factor 8-like isoform X2 n=1 Tax=Ceratina calcarata TaxID=156304 RepID=A0AAJ7RYY3_9HYME|nr:DDB1- and CUL4-associated factor 8-like isoform X2 [Ceratina calcarata]